MISERSRNALSAWKTRNVGANAEQPTPVRRTIATADSDACGANSPDQRGAHGSSASGITVTGIRETWLIPIAIVAGIAMGVSVMVATLYPDLNAEQFARQDAKIENQRVIIQTLESRVILAEREARVATERLSDVRDALASRGIRSDGH